ncbi:MAG: hypothetical protein CBB99_03730 [Bacteroidetes bacterium TMED39]|nr:MAG: hypothetical protein CBB99_03730 [Bacteroidetes bacterium TMED39]
MKIKKNPEIDLGKKRSMFLRVGMILSLGTVLVAFNLKSKPQYESSLGDLVIDEDIEIIDATVQEKKLPPPPHAPPELEIVEDDEIIEEDQPEIEETEVDQETEIEPVVDIDDGDEVEETNEIFEFFQVQEKASFPGGDAARNRYLAENLEYPPMANENEIQGRVMVQFVVWKDGSIRDVQILGKRRFGFGLEEEAMRVVKAMPRWTPAKQRDKAVPMRFRLPILFQLN